MNKSPICLASTSTRRCWASPEGRASSTCRSAFSVPVLLGSGTCWGREMPSASMPGEQVCRTHRLPQPLDQPTPGNRQSARPPFCGFWHLCGFCDRGHKPVRACIRIRGVALRSRGRNRQFQKRPDLLLECSQCFYEIACKPHGCSQETELSKEASQRVPIALHPRAEFVHFLSLGLGQSLIYMFGANGENWYKVQETNRFIRLALAAVSNLSKPA